MYRYMFLIILSFSIVTCTQHQYKIDTETVWRWRCDHCCTVCDWAEADRQWEHTRGSSYLPSPSPLCLPAGHTPARWLAAVSPHHFDLVYSLALNGTLLRPCDQCQSVKPPGGMSPVRVCLPILPVACLAPGPKTLSNLPTTTTPCTVY